MSLFSNVFHVCLSKQRKKKQITVKVLSEKHVPKKGEEIQIVGKFRIKRNAEALANYPDTKKAWGTALFVTDETMWDYLPHR